MTAAAPLALSRRSGARAILGLTAMAAFVACTPTNVQTTSAPTAGFAPNTILLRGHQLAISKGLLAGHDASLAAPFNALITAARAALDAPLLSVMQKGRTPPTGDKHDYMSMAPYFWPNPKTPNGLPYVNRDGEMNPESRRDHDGLRLQATIAQLHTLALAWYFTNDPRYADGAALRLRHFFIDPATRMNPNLNFAQAVLGVSEGRSFGIIDTRHMPELVDAERLLEGSPGWKQSDHDAMLAWCRGYLSWMLESPNGIKERDATNNHGTFYDEQVVALALLVGDTVLARKTITESEVTRIASQIDADGKQKRELDRTRPLHYTLFNLDAFTMLAELARHVDVDLWNYAAPNGGSIRKALSFVAPYADPQVKFPLPDVAEQEPSEFLPPLRRAAARLHDSVFIDAIGRIPATLRVADPERLGFPGLP